MNGWEALVIVALVVGVVVVVLRLRDANSRDLGAFVQLHDESIERLLKAATRGMVVASRGIGESLADAMVAVFSPPPSTDPETHIFQPADQDAYKEWMRAAQGAEAAGQPTPPLPWYLHREDPHLEDDDDPLDLDAPLDSFNPNPAPPLDVDGVPNDPYPEVDVEGSRAHRAVGVPPGYDPIAEMQRDAQ